MLSWFFIITIHQFLKITVERVHWSCSYLEETNKNKIILLNMTKQFINDVFILHQPALSFTEK